MAIWDFRPRGDLCTGVAGGRPACGRRGYTLGMVRYQICVEDYSEGRIHALRNGSASLAGSRGRSCEKAGKGNRTKATGAGPEDEKGRGD